MTTRLVIIVIAVIILLFICYKIFFQEKAYNQKVFVLPSTSLNSSTLEFKKQLVPPGKSSALFIIPSNDTYVVAKFSWSVVPDSKPIQEEVFVLQNDKLEATDMDLAYDIQTKSITGTLSDGTTIDIKQNKIISVNNQTDFKKIQKLPGWGNSTYTEK